MNAINTGKTSAAIDGGLKGVAVYNPSLWNDDELAQYFIARQDILARIIDGLHREKPNVPGQHQLLLGLRGMGKTTLLRRIALAVRQDKALNQLWLPLSFPEEQYNVKSLKDLWLNCLDALGDVLEAQGKTQQAEQLDELVEQSKQLDADAVLEILLGASQQHQRRLLLLIDNIDLVFDRLKKDHWYLREILQSKAQIQFIGASARAVEATYQYDAAFYDFFKVFKLKPLTHQETNDILRHLANKQQLAHVNAILDNDPARIKTLHTLTGGNPRTVVLLFKVLSQGLDGDVRSDLEGLLDLVTPLYKARFEELPDAAQQLVDVVALHWDPISANQLAEKLGVAVNNISAQLSRLESNGVIEKVPPAQGKRASFQISERFFNIWYLMRASRRVRRKLVWLVYFLKMFFNAQELQSHGQRQLRHDRFANQRDAEYSLALAQTVPSKMRRALEHRALYDLYHCNEDHQQVDAMFDLSGEDKSLASPAERIKTLEKLSKRLTATLQQRSDHHIEDIDEFVLLAMGEPDTSLTDKQQIIDEMETSSVERLKAIEQDFEVSQRFFSDICGELAQPLYQAIAQGLMTWWDDDEGAEIAALRFEQPALAFLPDCIAAYCSISDDSAGVERQQQSCQAVIALLPNVGWPLMCLAQLMRDCGDIAAAEKLFIRALEIHPEYSFAHYRLGELYCYQQVDLAKAQQCFEKCIELGDSSAVQFYFLAISLVKQGQFELAANDYQQADELNDNIESLINVCNILCRYQDWSMLSEHFTRLLRLSGGSFADEWWPNLIKLFQQVIVNNRTQDLLTVLDNSQMVQHWRPLREALFCIVAGDNSYLNGVAPEVREPALSLIEQLTADER